MIFFHSESKQIKHITIHTKAEEVSLAGEKTMSYSCEIEFEDLDGRRHYLRVFGPNIQSVTPSFNPYVGTERGSDDLPF